MKNFFRTFLAFLIVLQSLPALAWSEGGHYFASLEIGISFG